MVDNRSDYLDRTRKTLLFHEGLGFPVVTTVHHLFWCLVYGTIQYLSIPHTTSCCIIIILLPSKHGFFLYACLRDDTVSCCCIFTHELERAEKAGVRHVKIMPTYYLLQTWYVGHRCDPNNTIQGTIYVVVKQEVTKVQYDSERYNRDHTDLSYLQH